MKCPCFSGEAYIECCHPYHTGQAAPSAETLMRSRFAAYALNKSDYIMETTDPDGPVWEADRVAWKLSIESFSKTTMFQGLDVHDATETEVEFTAHLKNAEGDMSFRERSLFTKLEGRWLYFEPIFIEAP